MTEPAKKSDPIEIKPILYAAAAFVLLPVAGVLLGAAIATAGAAYFGLGAWYVAGIGLLGAVAGYFPGQFAGVWTARYQIQKVVVQLASAAAETTLTRLARFLAKKTKVSAAIANPATVDVVKGVTEDLVKDKPKSLFGLAMVFSKAAMRLVFRKKKAQPAADPSANNA